MVFGRDKNQQAGSNEENQAGQPAAAPRQAVFSGSQSVPPPARRTFSDIRRTGSPFQSQQPVQRDQGASKPAEQGTTVSINIHLPKASLGRFGQPFTWLFGKVRGFVAAVRNWGRAHRWWNIAAAIVLACIIAAVVLFKTVLHKDADTTTSNANSGNFAAIQPDFKVVAPKNKPTLAKANGNTTAFDKNRDTYSYTDSMQTYGFIVSEQPVPKKFKKGQDAVNSIAPTLAADSTQQPFTTKYGTGYILTNTKFGSQTVVASVKNVLIFIQVAHTFKASDWTGYVDSLQ